VRVITFKLDEETLERLDILAMRRRVPRSELIREAIIKLLRNEFREPSRPFKFTVRRVVIA